MPAGIDEAARALETMALERRRHALIGRASQHEKCEECGDSSGGAPQTERKRDHKVLLATTRGINSSSIV
jgi:hypothetical protein